MKLKLFTVASSNRKPRFDDLGAIVDEWLVHQPCAAVENIHAIASPHVGLNSHSGKVP